MNHQFQNQTTEAKQWIATSISDEYLLEVFTVGMRSTHNDCFIEVIEGLPPGSKIVCLERTAGGIDFVVEHNSLEWVMPGEEVPYRNVTMRRSCAVIDSPTGGGR